VGAPSGKRLAVDAKRCPQRRKLGHIAFQVGNMTHASSQTPLTTLNVLDADDLSQLRGIAGATTIRPQHRTQRRLS